MTNQRLYPDIILGFGTQGQTIAKYGCYLCALLQGILDRGYKFSVPEWNTYLKDHGAFSGTMLSASRIAQTCPDIFLEGRNESWNDAKLVAYMADKSYVVLGEVDARGIGGSGQHFVYIEHIDVLPVSGKISMSYIGDPWDGLENQKVTTRYNAYGNILSLRVFKIKQGTPMPTTGLYEYLGVTTEDEAKAKLTEHLGQRDGKCDWGNASGTDTGGFLGSARREIASLQATHDADVKAAHDSGFSEGVASVPSTNPPQPTPPVDMTKYEDNEVTIEKTVENTKYITKYRKKG